MTISELHAELTRLIAEGHGGLDVVITMSQWSEGMHGDDVVGGVTFREKSPYSEVLFTMTDRVLHIG